MNSSKIELQENKSLFYKIKNKIMNRIENSQNRIYLKLFLLGENTLEEETKENYQTLGISHLFAISGMHITLLTSIIMYILKRKIKNSYILFSIFFLLFHFYMALTNFSPSIIRAIYLFLGSQIKRIFKIPLDNKWILGIIFFIMLLLHPFYLYNIGFLFSFSISFGLLISSKKIEKYKNYFSKLLVTSCISFLISIPILGSNFHEIYLLTPIFNVLFVPFVSIIVFPFSWITFIIPFLDPILSILIAILEYVVELCNRIPIGRVILPHVPIWFYLVYYILLFLFYKKETWIRFFLIFLLFLVHINIRILNRYPIITMIDVGQGDSILIELPHNKGNILIDTGGTLAFQTEEWKKKKKQYSIVKNITIPYLKSIGISKIDLLILTHGDYDHVGEAVPLIENFKVHHVFFNSGRNNALEKSIIDVLERKKISYQFINQKTYKIKNYLLEFLNPKNSKNENEDSLIVYTNLNHKNILLMGDAGEIAENKVMNAYNLKKMDILKVGHHGSKYSSSSLFLKEIIPTYAFISAGRNNRFNHPHLETIARLKEYAKDIKITSEVGMIRAILKKNIEIQTCLKVR